MLLTLVVYALIGGLRVIIGVVFLFMILSYWLVFLLIAPIVQMDFLNFLPIMDRGITEIFRGVTATAYIFTGFEILFFIYPFVSSKGNIGKPLFLGFSLVAFLAVAVTVISIGFLSHDQLERGIWPVLNLYKIQTTPIIERLDYIIVAEWMMVTVPKMILLMWCLTYIAKRIYNIPKNVSTYVTAGILLAFIPFFTRHFDIQILIESSRHVSVWLIYIYPFILFPFVIIKKKRQEKQKGEKGHAKS